MPNENIWYLWRIAADYRPKATKELCYVVLARNSIEARRLWNDRFPWLKISQIRKATTEEQEEFNSEFAPQTRNLIAVWTPRAEKSDS